MKVQQRKLFIPCLRRVNIESSPRESPAKFGLEFFMGQLDRETMFYAPQMTQINADFEGRMAPAYHVTRLTKR